MKIRDYDKINHCCKHCGNLIPFTQKDIDSHTPQECLRIKYYYDQRIKEVYKCPLQ
jgi:hypothetical protein